MKTTKNYIEINKKSWNNKTESHVNSEFYDMKGFLSGQNSLNEIELELLDTSKVNLFYIYNVTLDKTAFH